jgi:hypothetical protein
LHPIPGLAANNNATFHTAWQSADHLGPDHYGCRGAEGPLERSVVRLRGHDLLAARASLHPSSDIYDPYYRICSPEMLTC